MEAICSSETSVDTQWTIRRYIPEGYTLNYRCENLKSYIAFNEYGLFSHEVFVSVDLTKVKGKAIPVTSHEGQ
jgi:hypothetical protein